MSHEAKDFVRKLLVVKPHRRMNYDQLVEHEWIRSSKTDKTDLHSRLKGLEEFSRKRRAIMAKLEAEKIAYMFGEMGGMFDDDDDDVVREKYDDDEEDEDEEDDDEDEDDEKEEEKKEDDEEDTKQEEVGIGTGKKDGMEI